MDVQLLKKRPLVALLSLSALLFFLLWAFRPQFSKQTAEKSAPIAVCQQQVRLGPHPIQWSAFGRLETPKLATLKAKTSGEIQELQVHNGDEVRAGQILMQLDPREAQANFEKAQAKVDEAQQHLAQLLLRHEQDQKNHKHARIQRSLAENALSRQKTLLAQQLTSQHTYEQTQSAYEKAKIQFEQSQFLLKQYPLEKKSQQAQVQQTQADLKRYQLQLEHTTVSAPFNGKVMEVFVSKGDDVPLNAPLLKLFSTQHLEVKVHLTETQWHSLKQSKGTVKATIAHQQHIIPLIMTHQTHALPPEGGAGIDVYFRMDPQYAHQFLLHHIYQLTLVLPEVPNTFTLPVQAFYPGNVIYRIEQGKLVKISGVQIHGEFQETGMTQFILSHPKVKENDWLLCSYLNHIAPQLIVSSHHE